MAQALPSFIELLASLELESDDTSEAQYYARYPSPPSFISSSPSTSLPSVPSSQASNQFLTTPRSASSPLLTASPSPSIIISHPSPVENPPLHGSRRRSISNRYSPYVPSAVLTRRRSLPGDLTSDVNHEQERSGLSKISHAMGHPMRRASLGNLDHEGSTHLGTSRITMLDADQPISALVRRRQPQNSPKSPERPKRRRSLSPTEAFTPVSIPSLPPLPRISSGNDSAEPFHDGSRHLPSISSLDIHVAGSPQYPGFGIRRAASHGLGPLSSKIPDASSFNKYDLTTQRSGCVTPC